MFHTSMEGQQHVIIVSANILDKRLLSAEKSSLHRYNFVKNPPRLYLKIRWLAVDHRDQLFL